MRTNAYVHYKDGHVDQAITAFLQKVRTRADKALRKNKQLLVRLADYLSDHRSMGTEQIARIVREYIPGFRERAHLSEGTDGFYRSRLKEQAR